eukprot:scaffold3_cov273-Pinguiococcus_pyrenoidosus.AAC.14
MLRCWRWSSQRPWIGKYQLFESRGGHEEPLVCKSRFPASWMPQKTSVVVLRSHTTPVSITKSSFLDQLADQAGHVKTMTQHTPRLELVKPGNYLSS